MVSSTLPPEEGLGKYGMQGLTSLVKMEQSDITNFALGQDISKCGLDLTKDSEILKTCRRHGLKLPDLKLSLTTTYRKA